MPKYLCLQRPLPGGNHGSDKPSPSQMQAMYAQFNAWREKFKDKLTDAGGKLGAGRLDEAIQVARECPGLVRPGGGVEVIEIHTS